MARSAGGSGHSEQAQVGTSRVLAFSLVTWGILTPFLLTSYGGLEKAVTAEQLLTAFAVAVAVHVALVLPVFLGAGWVEARLRRWPWRRWSWVALVVVGLAFGRPLTLSALQVVVGVPAVATDWALRFAMNAILLGVAIVLIAVVRRALERRSWVRDRLDRVLEAVQQRAAAATSTTMRLVEEFETNVAAPVREALAAARVEPFDAARQEVELRRVAHEVVRPLSHHVFRQGGDDDPPLPLVAPTRSRLPERILAAQPWLIAAVFGAMMLPTTLIGYGALGMLPRLGIVIGLTLVGGWAIARIRLGERRRQLLVLVAAYTVLAVAVAFVVLDDTVFPLPPPQPAVETVVFGVYWVTVPSGFVVIAMLLTIARSAFVEYREIERDLAVVVREREREAAAARVELAATRDRLARVLHHHIQGEVIALALRLRLGSAGEDDVAALLTTVDRQLAEAIAPEQTTDTVSPATLARNAELAIQAWSRAIAVRSRADPEVWDWLAPRPRAAAIILDAAVEGLTNAVRHDEARAAELEFARTPEGVRMTLRAPGRLRGAAPEGFGLRDLRRRGATVDLAQDGREVVLGVEVVAS